MKNIIDNAPPIEINPEITEIQSLKKIKKKSAKKSTSSKSNKVEKIVNKGLKVEIVKNPLLFDNCVRISQDLTYIITNIFVEKSEIPILITELLNTLNKV